VAKRFTDSDKWKKPFIKQLPLEYKIFWLYLLDDCDHAGIWHVDMEIAEIKLGTKLSLEKARGLFGERVVEFDNGTKWFIPDFIAFQYGELTERNKMFKPVSAVLSKYCLMGHISPINGGQVQVQVKVQEQVQDSSEWKPELKYVIQLMNHEANKIGKRLTARSLSIESEKFIHKYPDVDIEAANKVIREWVKRVPQDPII